MPPNTNIYDSAVVYIYIYDAGLLTPVAFDYIW